MKHMFPMLALLSACSAPFTTLEETVTDAATEATSQEAAEVSRPLERMLQDDGGARPGVEAGSGDDASPSETGPGVETYDSSVDVAREADAQDASADAQLEASPECGPGITQCVQSDGTWATKACVAGKWVITPCPPTQPSCSASTGGNGVCHQ